jgi:hypothetical protein
MLAEHFANSGPEPYGKANDECSDNTFDISHHIYAQRKKYIIHQIVI